MSGRRIGADLLRRFVELVFERAGYSQEDSTDAADVLVWASLRGVDTHGVRNLKSYYVDRTLAGALKPGARMRIDRETPHSASLDGDSGLGLAVACHAMRLAIEKSQTSGVGLVCMRNTHHLGPAGYFAHMAVAHGMLGMCMTGHFFGKGHTIGIAPPGGLAAMFSTNPLSFAAPCERHPPFVLDMSTSVATVNRLEMYAQDGSSIPSGWACDAAGHPTTDPTAARLLLPLGGAALTGGYKGAGLAMMVSILSGVLSGAWARVETAGAEQATTAQHAEQYDQPAMGHFFAAVRIDAFTPLDQFRRSMDAMIDALHAAPLADPNIKVCYPGECESATAAERMQHGIPISDRVWGEFEELAAKFDISLPAE